MAQYDRKEIIQVQMTGAMPLSALSALKARRALYRFGLVWHLEA
jgi:hypothetical protein